MNDEQREIYARDLLNNELLDEILDEMVAENLEEWRRGEAKESCWHLDKAVHDLAQRIRNSLNLTEKES